MKVRSTPLACHRARPPAEGWWSVSQATSRARPVVPAKKDTDAMVRSSVYRPSTAIYLLDANRMRRGPSARLVRRNVET